ncbi:MAG: right-handed parallel beta-helix repeat-containing protein, partial [Lentisphaeria bacterium]|nr:right-handed parallel beta-helix repeat-containing protein [Lentisphaeria bacterium]
MRYLAITMGVALFFLGVPLRAEDGAATPAQKILLPNGGFEVLTPAPGVPEMGGKYLDWTLKSTNLLPEGWRPNAWFKGELEIVKDKDPAIGHVLRISAPPERDAHIVMPTITPEQLKGCNALDFRVRYRGGPVGLRSYESRTPGKSPTVVTVDTSSGDIVASLGNTAPWRVFTCRYLLPEVEFHLALAVAAGATAEVDAAELTPVAFDAGGAGQWINARDFGASGSGFETVAKVVAGSREIAVSAPGDFEVGQAVALSKCHPEYSARTVRGPLKMYGRCDVAFDDALELRGFDGSGGDWLVFLVELTAVNPRRFRWSDDLARSWKGRDVEVTGDWQALSGGLEIRFKDTDKLQPGHVLSVNARTQLTTIIERIEGKTIVLRDTPTRTAEDAVLRHLDRAALQRALDAALKLKRNLFVPDGHYRLDRGLVLRNANITIAGRSGEKTFLDISDGVGAIFSIYSGRNVTIRNLKMVGHTSLAQKPGTMRNVNKKSFWCCALKPCSAMKFHGVENMLVENVHVSKMASEAFYCQGVSRVSGKSDPACYTRTLTFRRCSVTDCAANAFNNNDTSENTTVEYCRIDGVGWHAYEGPGRFIRLVGNYIRNAGPFTIGDMNSRPEHLNELGCGQAMIRDNVFESGGRCAGIVVNHGARQVTIANNIFLNYNGDAITVSGRTTRTSFAAKNMTITGNIIDLTYRGDKPRSRTGIKIDASHVIASDNQIYVRGERIIATTGISITEGIQGVIVHDNLIRNCGFGL